jgi:hypothetical protein
VTKVYFCSVPHCRKARKCWPRSDNFRAHVRRLHPKEDAKEIVRRSVSLEARRFKSGQLISRRSQQDARDVPPIQVGFQGQPKNGSAILVHTRPRSSDNFDELSAFNPSLLSIAQNVHTRSTFFDPNPANDENLHWDPPRGQADQQEDDDIAQVPQHSSTWFKNSDFSQLDNLGPPEDTTHVLDSANVEYPKEVYMPESESLVKFSSGELSSRDKVPDGLSKTSAKRSIAEEMVIERISDDIMTIVAPNMTTDKANDTLESTGSGLDSPRIQDGSQESSRSSCSPVSSTSASDPNPTSSRTKEEKSSARDPEVARPLKQRVSEIIRNELPGLREASSRHGKSRGPARSGSSFGSISSKASFGCDQCDKLLSRKCDLR